MYIRKHWIALAILIAVLMTGCSQAPKMSKVAGTVVDPKGVPVSQAGLIIGSTMAHTNAAGQFTISAPSGPNKAVILTKGCSPEIISLNLAPETQTVTLKTSPTRPSKRVGQVVDYLILLEPIISTDIGPSSPFTYLGGTGAQDAALTHAGIFNLTEAVEYLSPKALQGLCDILKARNIVWVNKDLDNHLQIFHARTGQISSAPFDQGKARDAHGNLRTVKKISALLANALQSENPPDTGPRGTEAKLAREVTAYMEQMYNITYTGKEIEHIRKTATPIIAASERPELRFTFGVLEANEYNAYALPGGYIYITRPLLEMLDSDDELAAVLAHEAAHITHMHAVKGYDRQTALLVAGVFLAVATGDVASSFDFVDAIGGIIKQGYSKEQEYDADRTGLRYMTRAGYEPDAMLSLLAKLQELEYRLTGGRQGYSRTHPATKQRVQQVKDRLHIVEYYRFIDMYLQSI
ncbi:MAG: M48 family metalloprotease [Firmicutes bacterium]|nr:M48 family metalloprotease [Bacillota bacterium]